MPAIERRSRASATPIKSPPGRARACSGAFDAPLSPRVARSLPYQAWWKDFLRDPGGTSFWHETYLMRGGMQAVFVDMQQSPVGLQQFAPNQLARVPMFAARARAGIGGGQSLPPAVPEDAAVSR